MKKFLLTLYFAISFFIINSCSSSDNFNNISAIKGGKLIASYSDKDVKNLLLKKGYITKNQTVYGYDVYKISYDTKDENGKNIKASGIITIANLKGNIKELAEIKGYGLVLDCHGTIFLNSQAHKSLWL
jgi:Skp family chaperone for outer membrane proteins